MIIVLLEILLGCLLSLLLPFALFSALKQRGLRSQSSRGFDRQSALALFGLWLTQLSALIAITMVVLIFIEHSAAAVFLLPLAVLHVLLSRESLQASVQLLLHGAQLLERVERAAQVSKLFGGLLAFFSTISVAYWWFQDCTGVGCIVKGVMIYSSLLALGYALLWLVYAVLLQSIADSREGDS
jgi:hypothetical protein